jgi:hypothetical protein
MARKPNYSFERQERDRAKALKLAQKADEKRQQREQDRARSAAPDSDVPPSQDQ